MNFDDSRFLIVSICLVALMGFPSSLFSQNSVLENFEKISSNPQIISYSNKIDINNNGGHLQGIQVVDGDDGGYAFLTGSSDSYAYCSIVRFGNKNEVISVNKLMDKPFKHSGGHQVFQNYMAIGIEDNSKKDKSKVCLYDISNPENFSAKPIAIIEREGKPMRSTAGCVALTKYKNNALIVVGDWDTKHLDFYTCEYNKLGKTDFHKVFSISTKEMVRKDWIDEKWESYQNINVFTSEADELYLIGLGRNEKDEDIADLFLLTEDNSNQFSLKKLASKTFTSKKKSSFKAGAGVVFNKEGLLQIYSCSYNIKGTSYLNFFDTQ